jgi:hypothetical protein
LAVPGFVVEEPREEVAAQGHDLRQFKYACAGYSMFVDDRDGKSGGDEAKALLPYCQGLEVGFHLAVSVWDYEVSSSCCLVMWLAACVWISPVSVIAHTYFISIYVGSQC